MMIYTDKIKSYTYDYVLWSLIFIGLTGITIHAIFGYSSHNVGHAIGNDDAYITYRYAENFYSGFGLVFNKDERVEGYSNFFYVLLMTPSFFFGKHYVYLYSLILNSILFSVSIFVFFNLIKKQSDRTTALISASSLSINPWIWVNVASGLEAIFVFLVSILILSSIDDDKKIKTLFYSTIFTILIRIDGIIIAFFSCIYLFIKKKYKKFYFLSFISALIFLIQSIFRYLYYGNILSNTFYAKIYSVNSSDKISYTYFYFFKNFLFTGLWFLSLFILFLSARKIIHKKYEGIKFYQFFSFLWIFYLFIIGGDNYDERFLLLLFPFFIYGVCCLSSHKKLIISLYCLLQLIFIPMDKRFHYVLNKYDPRIVVGEFIKKHYPGHVIAVDAAGKIPFFSGAQTIDILGLNDPYIAKKTTRKEEAFIPGHLKYDPLYVLGKNPDLIMSWIQENEDLFWGMTQERYSKNYFLKYLVNFNKENRFDKNIIDVKGMSSEEIKNLIKDKYIFAILERKNTKLEK